MRFDGPAGVSIGTVPAAAVQLSRGEADRLARAPPPRYT